jgi:hypothetical protein
MNLGETAMGLSRGRKLLLLSFAAAAFLLVVNFNVTIGAVLCRIDQTNRYPERVSTAPMMDRTDPTVIQMRSSASEQQATGKWRAPRMTAE